MTRKRAKHIYVDRSPEHPASARSAGDEAADRLCAATTDAVTSSPPAPADMPTKDSLLAAVDARSGSICRDMNVLTPRNLRRLLEGDLNLPTGALDAPRFREAVKRRVDELLTVYPGAAVGPSLAQAEARVGPRHLPPDAVIRILQNCDHETLALAAQVCRGWRDAAQLVGLWEGLYRRHGWQQADTWRTPASPVPMPFSHPDVHVPEARAAFTWLQRYKEAYRMACYDCMRPCARTTFGWAALVLRLCRTCSQGGLRGVDAQPTFDHNRTCLLPLLHPQVGPGQGSLCFGHQSN